MSIASKILSAASPILLTAGFTTPALAEVTVQGGYEVSAFQPSDLGLKWPEVRRS